MMNETLKTESVKKMLEIELLDAIFNIAKSDNHNFDFLQGRLTSIIDVSIKLGFANIAIAENFKKAVSVKLSEAPEEVVKQEEQTTQ